MSVTAILPLPVRFADRRDAVFGSVAGLSPLVRVLRALERQGGVVVTAGRPLAEAARKALAECSFSAVRVIEAESPGDRAQCVAAGLRGLAGGGHVVVHDIEWPLVGADTLERIVVALREGAVAVLPVRLVTDSIKAVDVDGVVTATEERSPLRTVQYPRGFDADVLARLVRDNGSESFDELEATLSAGVAVTLIEGDDEALSVELPRDAGYLAAVIAGRQDVAGH